MVVLDADSNCFVACNEHAVRLYGLSRAALVGRTPAEVSPEFQPDGRSSAEAAREKIQQALEGQAPVFEWMHKHSSGRLVPCEVRLVGLPSESRKLIRGSVIDNTERYRKENVQDVRSSAHGGRLESPLRTRPHDHQGPDAGLKTKTFASAVCAKATSFSNPWRYGEPTWQRRKQRLYLAHFIALLMVRSPKFDRVANEIADAAAKHLVKHAIPTGEAAGELLRRYGNENEVKTEITPESMFKFIQLPLRVQLRPGFPTQSLPRDSGWLDAR